MISALPVMIEPERTELPALLALLAGALAIGSSGIFVRLADTGPVAGGGASLIRARAAPARTAPGLRPAPAPWRGPGDGGYGASGPLGRGAAV